jgi:hypothetical protein
MAFLLLHLSETKSESQSFELSIQFLSFSIAVLETIVLPSYMHYSFVDDVDHPWPVAAASTAGHAL